MGFWILIGCLVALVWYLYKAEGKKILYRQEQTKHGVNKVRRWIKKRWK